MCRLVRVPSERVSAVSGIGVGNFRYRILGTRLRQNSFRGQNYDSATGAVTLISFTTSLSLYFLFL